MTVHAVPQARLLSDPGEAAYRAAAVAVAVESLSRRLLEYRQSQEALAACWALLETEPTAPYRRQHVEDAARAVGDARQQLFLARRDCRRVGVLPSTVVEWNDESPPYMAVSALEFWMAGDVAVAQRLLTARRMIADEAAHPTFPGALAAAVKDRTLVEPTPHEKEAP